MRSEAPIDGRVGENDAAGWRLGADDLSTCGSLALLLISAFLLNAFVFPSVALVFPAGRELSTYCGVAFSVIVAVAAYRRPTLLRESAWSFACLGLFAIGLVMLGAGLSTGSPLLVALGSPFGGIGSVWFSVLVGLRSSTWERSVAWCDPHAFVVKYAVQFGVAFVGASRRSCGGAPALLRLHGAVVPAHSPARSRYDSRHSRKRLPTVLDATNPSSFLPFLKPRVPYPSSCSTPRCGYAFGSQGTAHDVRLPPCCRSCRWSWCSSW